VVNIPTLYSGGPGTSYPDRGVCAFTQSLQANARIVPYN